MVVVGFCVVLGRSVFGGAVVVVVEGGFFVVLVGFFV